MSNTSKSSHKARPGQIPGPRRPREPDATGGCNGDGCDGDGCGCDGDEPVASASGKGGDSGG